MMDKDIAAEKLLNDICSIDPVVCKVMLDEKVRTHVLSELELGFDKINKTQPELVDNVIDRIVNYHKVRDDSDSIAIFMHLPNWYALHFEDPKTPPDWWDPNGKYYGLRMSEVINFYLIAEDHFRKEENKNETKK